MVADEFFNGLTIFLNQECWNRHNAKLLGYFLFFIYVHLEEFYLTVIFFAEGINYWPLHTTRPTPWCPKVNNGYAFCS